MNESSNPAASVPTCSRESFLALYLNYTEETEPPTIYHRWAALAGLGAFLGRDLYFQHGHFSVHTNIYCMLIGDPGTRKSTTIRIMRKLLITAGYNTIAADKSTKEKFLVDLQGETEELFETSDRGRRRTAYDRSTAENLWGSTEEDDNDPREIFITADEFNDFIGTNNVDFCRTLGQLWDYEGVYKSRIKNGKSVAIPSPTVSILGGITPEDFAKTFPPEAIGIGFMSRLLLVRGELSGRKITFPDPPNAALQEQLAKMLLEIKKKVRGAAEVTPEAATVLDSIYNSWPDIPDVRFRHYSTRRFTQLLKIALIVAATQSSKKITKEVVIEANTILSAAELLMPKALGEFGKAKHSDTANKIVELLSRATRPLGFKDLWKEVHKDLEKPQELALIIQSLEQADKVHHVKTATISGWLPKAQKKTELEYVNWELLTTEERKQL